MVGSLNVVFATYAGLWGVLVIDMIQFFIKMSAVIAAAYFAVMSPQVGGLGALMEKLSTRRGPGGLDYTSLLPDFSSNWDLAIAVFIMPIAVQWWAVWYPGSEPGGGSYIAQRMLASKSEKDALKSVLFFNFAHYVLRTVAVDPGRALFADCLSRALRHSARVSQPRSDVARTRHRVPRDVEISAGRVCRLDGRRPDRGELVDHPHAPQLGRVVSGA